MWVLQKGYRIVGIVDDLFVALFVFCFDYFLVRRTPTLPFLLVTEGIARE